jgi:hypothetical protein
MSRQKDIMNMNLEDIEKELAASGWKPKPEDDLPISEETAHAMDANLKMRVECMGTMPWQAVKEVEKNKARLSKGVMALLLLGLMGPLGCQRTLYSLSLH